MSKTFRYLTRRDVMSAGIGLEDAVETSKEVLKAHAARDYRNPPKPTMSLPDGGFFDAMPACLPGLGAAGIKWISVFPDNYRHSLPSAMGTVILNDPETGEPAALMEGGTITALRTAAASAVAVEYLANPGAAVLGIVGTGVQGRFHLRALAPRLKNLSLVKIYDISEEFCKKFASEMQDEISAQIEICGSAEEVIRGADVVVTATGNLMGKPPVFMESWLKPGVHVIPVHNYGWEYQALCHAGKLVVDDINQFSSGFHKDSWNPEVPPCYGELSEIVAGKKAGRESEEEIIFSIHTGMAIQDIALALRVLRAAEEKGLGTELPPLL